MDIKSSESTKLDSIRACSNLFEVMPKHKSPFGKNKWMNTRSLFKVGSARARFIYGLFSLSSSLSCIWLIRLGSNLVCIDLIRAQVILGQFVLD